MRARHICSIMQNTCLCSTFSAVCYLVSQDIMLLHECSDFYMNETIMGDDSLRNVCIEGSVKLFHWKERAIVNSSQL